MIMRICALPFVAGFLPLSPPRSRGWMGAAYSFGLYLFPCASHLLFEFSSQFLKFQHGAAQWALCRSPVSCLRVFGVSFPFFFLLLKSKILCMRDWKKLRLSVTFSPFSPSCPFWYHSSLSSPFGLYRVGRDGPGLFRYGLFKPLFFFRRRF